MRNGWTRLARVKEWQRHITKDKRRESNGKMVKEGKRKIRLAWEKN